MKRNILLIMVLLFCISNARTKGQSRDKAIFREPKSVFFQNYILRDVREVRERSQPAKSSLSFVVDLSTASLPNKINLYKDRQWHNPPVSQGNTNTCWSFSTTSFLESEVYRINKMKVRLSEMYTVYWEYVEKTRRYIRERGNSLFEEGSEANAVTRMWSMYGAVPYEAYTGLINGRKHHTHAEMIKEMQNYLASVKESAAWDEEAAVTTIRAIMHHHMGVPLEKVNAGGREMTPVEYVREYLMIDPADYVDILSYTQEPFYRKVKYDVPDNWWHNSDYHNVPLDVFMSALKDVVRKGYTVSIGGDVSEPGFDRLTQCAVIPDFDIPSAYINDNARQLRFSNRTTTDDHGMHLVGYLEIDGKDWYLIKDSGSGSRNNDPEAGEFGYYFFSEDYVKLKMMDFMVHRDAVKQLLEKF